ncbi:hypothetical protein A1D29_10510 [Pasteurellaceae bacterium Orientalotternb1]|nr:hypothetical protein A1D29_10510 [Pasteurellaceae bacterium Orientalotternb1]
MQQVENLILSALVQQHPNLDNADFWETLLAQYGEIALNKALLALYQQGYFALMPYHKKSSPLEESPYKIAYRAIKLKNT